jgi:hypothetical protein
MKSGKQRKEEIKVKRLERLAKLNAMSRAGAGQDVRIGLGAVLSDVMRLAPNNTYGTWPSLYLDRPFVCRNCQSEEIWTAKQQKWWYEIAKGPIYSTAVRCRPCRMSERARANEARRTSLAGMARKIASQKLKEEND